jgi:hypothetical protein
LLNASAQVSGKSGEFHAKRLTGLDRLRPANCESPCSLPDRSCQPSITGTRHAPQRPELPFEALNRLASSSSVTAPEPNGPPGSVQTGKSLLRVARVVSEDPDALGR